MALRRAHPAGEDAKEARDAGAEGARDAAGGAGAEGARGADAEGEPSRCGDAPGATPAVEGALGTGVDAVAARFDLTRREREILGYLARGRSARFIAEELVISENTVWAHIKRVYAKTGVHSKQELMSVVEKQAGGDARQ